MNGQGEAIDRLDENVLFEDVVDTGGQEKKYVNETLANLVSAFHGLIVLFVLLVPFLDTPYFFVLHFTFCVSLLVHWWGNSNVCSLSVLESKLRGLDYTESFTHQFVGPLYDISKTTWSRVCYIVTIILMCMSAYKIYTSNKWSEALRCYNIVNTDPKYKDLPFYKKIVLYFDCFRILLCLV